MMSMMLLLHLPFLMIGILLPATEGFGVEVTAGKGDYHLRQQSSVIFARQTTAQFLLSSRTSSDTFASSNCFESVDEDADIGDAGANVLLLLEKIDTLLHSKVPNLESIQTDIMQKINESFNADIAFCSSFASEERSEEQLKCNNQCQNNEDKKYEKLANNLSSCSSFLAIRTIDDPILDHPSIQAIRHAAELLWFGDGSDVTANNSRFTYQRKGNYEAHLVDLAKRQQQNENDDASNHYNECDNAQNKRDIFTIMNDALQHRIYPVVREAFYSVIPDIDDIEFCVYDSLVIRYNSTEAMMGEESDPNSKKSGEQIFLGANQPLHRDLGLVSVNIMLNSDKEFEGGGTFFEDQMISKLEKDKNMQRNTAEKQQDKVLLPLKPKAVGQALAHLSSKRHAGAGTTAGIRDILVVFVTAKNKVDKSESNVEAPKMEKAARLKAKAREYAQEYSKNDEELTLYRILAHRLAAGVILDGEAWHYLGMGLRDYISRADIRMDEKKDLIHLSISCLKLAFELTPCDGRLCNNLGLAHETLFQLTTDKNCSTKEGDLIYHSKKQQEQITSFYEQSDLLHNVAQRAGCDVQADADQTCLNHGLYLSKQDRFTDAARILSRFDDSNAMRNTISDPKQLQIEYDARRLLHFCRARSVDKKTCELN